MELPDSGTFLPRASMEVQLSPAQPKASVISTSAILLPLPTDIPVSAQTLNTEKVIQNNTHLKQKGKLLRQQLQQLLTELLNVDPIVTGSCILVEAENGVNHRLKCNSSAMYEVLYKHQQNIAESLIELRDMNIIVNGFSAELVKQKMHITINQEPEPQKQ